MHRDDRIRIQHMLDAAREALAFAAGKTRDDLDTDRVLTLALIKSIEIIGEAAARISTETKTATPALPWRDIVGMRNRLVHVYFDVNLDIVWSTVEEELPELIAELEAALQDNR